MFGGLPVRATRSRVRRGGALVATGAVIGAVALLVTEAMVALLGDASMQPPGSADAVVGAGDERPLRLVVLGDSTGAAVGAGDVALGYPRRVAEALAAGIGSRVDLRVLAVSGARVADVRSGQLQRLSGLRPDLVLLVVGGNDGTHMTPVHAVRVDLRAIIEGASATGAHVIVAGIPAMGTIRRFSQPLRALTGALAEWYDAVWREETNRAGAARIELAAQTERPFREDPSLLSEDGLHPSASGYAVWADVIAPVAIAVARTLTG
jgi:lysophospholipase L1-like esterase